MLSVGSKPNLVDSFEARSIHSRLIVCSCGTGVVVVCPEVCPRGNAV